VELIRTASLDLLEKLRIAVDVSGILSGIHAQQVMHKDISSSNILMANDATSSGGAP
jgi:tRNA A-37 threonylcarbamoyl transferase component Bud32